MKTKNEIDEDKNTLNKMDKNKLKNYDDDLF